jgi:hypothetical protein
MSSAILTIMVRKDTEFASQSQLFGTIDSEMQHLTRDDFSFCNFDGNVLGRPVVFNGATSRFYTQIMIFHEATQRFSWSWTNLPL